MITCGKHRRARFGRVVVGAKAEPCLRRIAAHGAAMSVEEAKAYVVNMKLAERLTEAVNAAIKEMPAKPYAFLVRHSRIVAILAPPP